MESGFDIAIDRRRGLLHLTLFGFLDLDQVRALDVERRAALAELRMGPNRHVTLCDVTGCKIQSQETVAAFREMLADTSINGRRIAFVVGSSLSRMQLRRIVGGPDMACFETIGEADAWLSLKADEDRVAA